MDAGVVMVTDPAHFGPGMLKLLGKRPGVQEVAVGAGMQVSAPPSQGEPIEQE